MPITFLTPLDKMPGFNFPHLMAAGTLFALWDAFGIGANDVANAFSTSVNAGVFTLTQVAFVAFTMETLGAITAGAEVSSTIQKGILQASLYKGKEGLLMLGMVCALMASSTFLQFANRMSLPVSTTHSIVGGVMGVGAATFGASGVEWGFCIKNSIAPGWATTSACADTSAGNPKYLAGSTILQVPGSGFGPIGVSWILSPIVSGALAATQFLITKHLVMEDNFISRRIYDKGTKENAFFRALYIGPWLYGEVAAILVVLLTYKGVAANSVANVGGLNLGSIAEDPTKLGLTAGICGLIIVIIAYVWVSWWQYRTLWSGEDLKWFEWSYHMFIAKRPIREGFDTTHMLATSKELGVIGAVAALPAPGRGFTTTMFDTVLAPNMEVSEELLASSSKPKEDPQVVKDARAAGYHVREVTESEKVWSALTAPILAGPIEQRLMATLLFLPRFFFCYGIQGAPGQERVVRAHGLETKEIQALHSAAPKFNDRAELVFRQMQMLTSAIASFSHGSNDVANAMGPLSSIIGVYLCSNTVGQTGAHSAAGYCNVATPAGFTKSDGVTPLYFFNASNGWQTPVWLLAVGGIMISIGFCTYGFHLMRSLGNNLTYHSPSRGYCMELGAAITVLVASRIGLPISTTQCITGATIAVGLLNGLRGVNWKRFASIFMSWVITMPIVGLYAGLIFLFMASNPTFEAAQINN